MAKQNLVSKASRAAGRSAMETAAVDKASKSAKHKVTGVLQQHANARPPRLALVSGMLSERGFSETVAERI
jgi:hypothetical protein